LGNKRLSRSTRLGHPRRQQSQSLIGLPDDKMLGAGMALRTDHLDCLAAARMESIEDPNLKRRTPGSMKLVRGCLEESIPAPFPATARASGEPGPNQCRLVQFAQFLPSAPES
jgi:hypothetical protein